MTTSFPYGGAAGVWADTDGGSAKEPHKLEIRSWGGTVETGLNGAETSIETLQADVSTLQAISTAGQVPRDPVEVVATANVALSGEQTIDGISTSTDRVAVVGQTDPSENGIYVTAAGAWARAADMDADADVHLSTVVVLDGTSYGGSTWTFRVSDPGTFTLDTDDITATMTGTPGAMTAYVDAQVAPKANSADLADVATSGGSDDLTEGATNLLMTPAERSKVAGVEDGADVTDADNIGSAIEGTATKLDLVNGDRIAILDSESGNALGKTTWLRFKQLIWEMLGVQINASTEKSALVDADKIPLADSEASSASKHVTWGSVLARLWARFGTLISAGTVKGSPVGADAIAVSDSAAGGATKQAALSALPISTATQNALDDKSDAGHGHASADISDSTAAGRAVLTASDAGAQRTALGLGTAAEAATDDFTPSSLVDAPLEPGTEMLLRDARGFVGLRLGANRLRSSQFEIGTERLKGGPVDMVASDVAGVRIRDSRGFWSTILSARSVARPIAQNGVYFRDARGFTVRLDQGGLGAPKTTPLHTNGAGIWAFRLMLARLAAGDATTARIALFGDSWHQHAYITQAVMDLLYARYGQGADGWISPTHDSSGAADENCNDVVVTINGWTEVDVTDDGGTVTDPWSITADYLEATGTLATWTATGLRAETIHILYQDGDGTFRYRIDGGSWVVVAGTDSGDPAKVTISGLSTAATHTVELDTTGNTGTAQFCGLYCTGIAGVEVSKCGNGGADSLDWDRIMASPMLAYILDLVDPHAATICLGTNDISNAVPPLSYRAAIEGMIDVIRAASPDCGIVLDPPNECFRSGTYVVADYTAQCAAMAEAGDDVDFINMMELIGPYASTQNMGIWRDNSHMNDLGGRLFAGHLVNTFFII